MTRDSVNLVVVGVGGQGIILVSKILGEAAVASGLDVMVSEIHGMAQRGGMVASTIRIGDVHSPMIGRGEADIMLGFEPVETYRHIDMISEKTTVITNTNPVYPFTVTGGEEQYPDVETILDHLESVCRRTVVLDTHKITSASRLPSIVNNILMLGSLMGAVEDFPVPLEVLKESIRGNVPPKFEDVNLRAFEIGFAEARSTLER
ncbi:MAG: indolepyruvate oxidoreductase subunit beta [Thermoplasmata archaeon]|nr:MAG: indolepyruvate oxidoreductase subunit beta [Thermoplasmata archaeon]